MLKKLLILALCLCMWVERAPAQQSSFSEEHLEQLLQEAQQFYKTYDYKNAIETNAKLIDFATRHNQHYYAFRGYTELGVIYSWALKDSVKGRINYENALIQAELSETDSLLSWGYSSIGNMYAESGNNYYKAISYFEKSIAIHNKNGEDEIKNLVEYMNIGWVYLDLNQPQKAFPYLLKAKRLAAFEEQSPLLHLNLKTLFGRYYISKEKYALANKELMYVAQVAEENDYVIQGAESNKYLAVVNEIRGDFEAANQNLKKATEFNNRIFALEKVNQIEEAGAKFELEQIQRDLNNAKISQAYSDELRAKTGLINMIIISALILSLFVMAGFYFLLRSRKKYVNKLSEKNAELTAAKDKAEKLSSLKTQFFSTVSHEIRTPLYGVIGLSSILLENEQLKEHREDLTSLKFSADYLLALINDVLLINKMDSEGVTLVKNPFRLSKLVQNIVRSFAFSLEQNNNNIHLEIDEQIPDFLLGDSIRLSQILMNLVGNAVKFNENGNIWLKIKLVELLQDGAHRIQFVIKDDGIGIAKNKQQVIFKEFSQVENKNYEYQGTGLGLPIVRKLLALHDSEVFLESSPNKGATFTFTIELSANPAYEKEVPAIVTEKEVVCEDAAFEEIHILVVDDNKINQKVTQKILETRNFQCSLADGGVDAIALAKSNHYQLILMDIHMPDMDGIEATKEIRKFDTTTPIVALTAVEAGEIGETIRGVGMNDIILKPYDVSQFLNTILRNLNKIHADAI